MILVRGGVGARHGFGIFLHKLLDRRRRESSGAEDRFARVRTVGGSGTARRFEPILFPSRRHKVPEPVRRRREPRRGFRTESDWCRPERTPVRTYRADGVRFSRSLERNLVGIQHRPSCRQTKRMNRRSECRCVFGIRYSTTGNDGWCTRGPLPTVVRHPRAFLSRTNSDGGAFFKRVCLIDSDCDAPLTRTVRRVTFMSSTT